MFTRITALLITLLCAAHAWATEFYVAPAGSSGGNGSISSPWSLATALSHPAAVRAGDKIWLRGGTYRGSFSSNLNGVSGAPIIVRQYPGERAILDGNGEGTGNSTLTINGSWTWYWGFEVMNSATNRYAPVPGSNGLNGWGVNVFGTNVKCINMVVHDNDQGFGFWVQADSSELYGNIIYDNGWQGPDRGHGHGIYVQNQNNTKRVADNIIFNQFSHGIHGYTTAGYLNNLYLEGNISFNNGTLEGGFERNILIGSDSGVVAQNPTLVSNYTYFTPSSRSGENNIGFSSGCTNATLTNNYLTGGTGLHLTNCSTISVSGNTFYDTAGSTPYFGGNTYNNSGNPPTGVKVFVRPNQYEAGRGNIAVFNWTQQSSVAVDLSGVITPGASFEIRDAENFSAGPIQSGVFNSSPVYINMTGLTVTQPNGPVPRVPSHTAPEFGAFIVLTTTGGAGGSDTQPPTVALTGITSGTTLSNTVTLSANATDNIAVAGVQYKLDGINLGPEQNLAPYNFSWNTASTSNGSHTLTASARDNSGNQALSTPVTITINNVAGPGANATFVRTDPGTQGAWKGSYGADGNMIANDSSSLPSYAQASITNQASFTWYSSTADVRAPQKTGSATDRIASCWYNRTSFSFDVNIADGSAHQVALYLLDWDNGYRAETIDVLDANTGGVLDSRNATNFVNGTYLVWMLKGHVILRITKTSAGANGVVSGLFFGGNTAGGDTTPPSISVSGPTSGQMVSGSISLSAIATDNIGVAGVQFQVDGLNTGTETTISPFSASWNTTAVANGPHTITAIARDAAGNRTTSSAVSVTVSNAVPVSGTGAATFVKVDNTTQGNWAVAYGGDGYTIATDTTGRNPAYAQYSTAGLAAFAWNSSTSDPRALQKNSASDREAVTWYGNPMLDCSLTDGKSHQVALYVLDWDYNGRAETIETIDAASGVILDTRTISNFTGGQYLVYTVSGHVLFRATKVSGSNAIISGIFFGGPAAIVGGGSRFVRLDTTTQGDWKGVYGKDGFAINSDATQYPVYAQVTFQIPSSWVWDGNATESRALISSLAGNRIASTWFSASPFLADINITDSSTHQVAMYFLDWEGGRSEKIELIDANNGTTLNTQVLTGFSGGQYIVWNVSGHVKIQISRISGSNGVISGVFFN